MPVRLNGVEFESASDAIRSIPDDSIGDKRIDHDLLASTGLKPGEPHPIHPSRLHSLLVNIIGHRQSTFNNLMELRDRRSSRPLELQETRDEAIRIMCRHFDAVCRSEDRLLAIAGKYWPTMALPHGAGSRELPPGIVREKPKVRK